jgi:hypothetical protein
VTDYSFDTSPLEHLEYPRDLRFTRILIFKKLLASKLNATYEKSKDKNYSTFLKHFGTFNVQSLKEKDGGISDYMVSAIENLTTEIVSLKRASSGNSKVLRGSYISPVTAFIDDALEDYYSLNRLNTEDLETNPKILNSVKHYIIEQLQSKHLKVSEDAIEAAIRRKLSRQ